MYNTFYTTTSNNKKYLLLNKITSNHVAIKKLTAL